ncbi:hypothetical protein KBY66_01045 [Synechococcus sp. Tobar12-5m-g]|jgi:hypothetical protein|uniref:hypothetical protein n=1 Tax=unclassified Synechococcus TaxID=2626047 RepID=UPI0020CEFDF1|nr:MULTISPECIES: hypothetical protein [unclassified Synechococcus]MCP9771221.1 hypothetical protein [Synechococcus sp. Tobar12-5m-g]MCP9872161.1 hypothetical protein [Synechococcus sp. Cruz CV-v-12]
MTRENDPFRIPRAGWEVAPMAGFASVDLNANGGAFSGGEFISERTVGGVLTYAIYQALLTALRTEALRKRGEINRGTQLKLILSTSLETAKTGVAVGAVLSVLLLVFPWLAFPLSVLGVVGAGKASIDLFHAFWDGLDEDQKLRVTVAAHEAGISLAGFFRGEGDGIGMAARG